MKLLKKIFPILGLLYFGWSAFGQTRGVSYDASPGNNTNVLQTVHQKFHSITNLASTAGEIAIHNAEEKLVSTNAAGVRGVLSVPVFDLTDPGAVNIFPFWDDTGNEVDWTSNTALRTLLGIDSNDAVTFGAVTGDSFVAGSTNMVGALAGKAALAHTHVGTDVSFSDPDSLWTAGNVDAALAELNNSINAGAANGAGAKVHWSQLLGVPAGFADGTDDGSGGGSAPVGTVVNTGASVQYALPRYSDTTGTNVAPSSLLTDATGTNFYAGGFLINDLTVTNPIPFTSGGFGIATGTSGGIPYFSSSTTVASSGALAANALVIGGGAGAAPSTTTTGSGILTWLGTPSSANLAAAVTGETGSGALVFATSPTLVTPVLGVAAATTVNTGNGDNELYPMNQDVQTTASPTFATVTVGTTNVAGALAATAKLSGGNTLSGAQLLAEGASIALDAAGSADGAFSGVTRAGTAGATLAFGDLVVLDATDSRWELADANSASGADGDSRGIIGICVLAAASDGSATTILLSGVVRADAAFPALTINGPIYISETAGDITQTSPTTEDNVVRILGAAWTADEIHFAPDRVWTVYDAP